MLHTVMVPLDVTNPIWESVFMVAPLVIVGTREVDGTYDLAPKHMASPIGWQNHYGFVCTPAHATYANAKREGVFTVSFPRPDQVVLTSLAAAPRDEDDQKHALRALPTVGATKVDGVLLKDANLCLECELDRVIDGFGVNSLLVGRVVAASASEDTLRAMDVDDQELIARAPLLAYVHPGRFAEIKLTQAFPFHAGFRR